MKKINSIIFVIFLLLVSNVTSLTRGLNDEILNTIYVDDDNIEGPWDGSIEHPFRFIQDAIDFSEDDNKIMVFNGTYNGDIIVNKSITIEGENCQNTIIDASIDNWGVYIGSSCGLIADIHVHILGFTIKNSKNPYSGLWIRASNTVVENCILKNNEYSGIYLVENRNNSVRNCKFYNNGMGLDIFYSDENIVKNNIFNSEFGIYLNSDENTITDNTFIQCGIDYSSTCDNNTISNNTVNNKPLIFLDGKKNISIENAGQIICFDCKNITIQNIDVTNASIGIQLFYSEDCIIQSNELSNNWIGITMMYSHHNYIENNEMNNVLLSGIYAYVSHFNTFKKNAIEDFMNSGILLYYSWINEIQHNFIKSHYQSYGICIEYSSYNYVENNTISLCFKGIYQHFWCNHTYVINNTIHSCIYSGLGLWNCSHITYSNNRISKCEQAIELSDSDNILIEHNLILNNGWGIFSSSTLNYDISNNMIKNNSHVGILSDSSRGIISKNIFDDNWADNFINGPYQVLINKNDFINHNINLHFVRMNNKPDLIQWNSNYWEDWGVKIPRPILGMRFLPINIPIPLPVFKFDLNPSKVPFNDNEFEITNKTVYPSSHPSKQILEGNIPNISDRKKIETNNLVENSLIDYKHKITPYNETHNELEFVFSFLSNTHNEDIVIQ